MTQNVTQNAETAEANAKRKKKKKEREEEEEEMEIREEGVHQRRRKDQRSSWVAARPGFTAQRTGSRSDLGRGAT